MRAALRPPLSSSSLLALLACAGFAAGCAPRRESPLPASKTSTDEIAASPTESSPAPEGIPSVPLEGPTWSLAHVGARSVSASEEKPAPSLQFDAGAKRAQGFAGCNHMTGGYERDGASLRFSAMATTRMMCLDSMELEAAFLAALAATTSYEIRAGQLALLDSTGAELAVLTPTP